jgi:hypothetical protein
MRIARPTPSFIVSVTALVVALGGTSYAAIQIGTKDLANGAVTSAKIKNKTIKTKDLSPKTVTALKGQTGPAGPAGPAGAQGPAGPAGPASGVRAYAVVDTNPASITSARSKGFATVTNPEVGTYCLNLTDASVDSSTLAPVVGVEWDRSSGFSLNAYASIGANDCPAGTDVGVKTYEWTSTTESAVSNEVAFTIVVP